MLLGFRDLKNKYNLNVTGIIHVGAHHGEEILDYISNDVTNMVLFEPLDLNFEILKSNMSRVNANIIGHQLALGNDNKKVIMHLSDNELQSSSILRPKKHLIQHPNVHFTGVEEVEMKKLDDFGYTEYNFINMDVQGYELEVLKGAENTLKYIDYVYCEVNRDEVYENNAYIEQIDDFLGKYNMKRVETDWSGNIWGDAFYVKFGGEDNDRI
jgi:FkbM family methyltransferase